MMILPRIKKILYLTDLSDNARQALGYALAAADAHEAEISILHVIEDIPPNAELVVAAFLGYGSIEELKSKTRDDIMVQIKNRLSEVCMDIGGRMPECRFIVKEILVETGRPDARILEHVSRKSYDLLIMGNHGHGLVKEMFAGSTARKVVLACKKPVMLVPLKE
jgi:nucleotide-binding universal stress UspA family protein